MYPISKKTLVLLAGLLMLVVLGLSLAYAQEEVIELNADPEVAQQRSAVAFSHDLHMGLYECLDCHHDFKEGVNVLDEDTLEEGNPDIRCSACHNDQADVDRQKAYHRQCMGCHIDTRKAGDASGPELCGACHLSAR